VVGDLVAFKYRAFLSYSHLDREWAEWLQEALESYRIDKDLVGRLTPAGPVPKTLRPIYRDGEEIAAGHSLNEKTLSALEASQFLVVLCSPNAAKSLHINEEVRCFNAMGRADRVMAVIVGGVPNDPYPDCFPSAVRYKVGLDGGLVDQRESLIVADARPQGDDKELAKNKVVARLLGLNLDQILQRAEQAHKQRARVRNGAIGFLLGAVIVFAGGVAWTRYELANNENFLDRTLQGFTGLALGTVSLSDVLGMPRSVSLCVLDGAERQSRNMAEFGRDTPQLRYRKASMLLEFGRSYERLGETAAQRTRVAEAQRLMQGLITESSGNVTLQRDLFDAYGGLAREAAARGAPDEALKNYRTGLILAERVAAADPNNPGWQRDLWLSHERIGDLQALKGPAEEALRSYRTALAIAERTVAANPANAGWQRDLSVLQNRIGDLAQEQGQLAEALRYYRASLAIRERLASADPKNSGWQRDLLVSHNKIGDVFMEQSVTTDALKNYRAGFAIAERLAAADPNNVQSQVDLLWAQWRLASNGDDPARRFQFIVASLRRLKDANKLSAEQARWLPIAEQRLAELRAR
jgi:tetratricopeptide (TPR) repeat protein